MKEFTVCSRYRGRSEDEGTYSVLVPEADARHWGRIISEAESFLCYIQNECGGRMDGFDFDDWTVNCPDDHAVLGTGFFREAVSAGMRWAREPMSLSRVLSFLSQLRGWSYGEYGGTGAAGFGFFVDEPGIFPLG